MHQPKIQSAFRMLSGIVSFLFFALAAAFVAIAAPTPQYGVHLESYKTKGSAEHGWKELQSTYPDLLQNHSYALARTDLGDIGVYYRVLVGPFQGIKQAGAMQKRFLEHGRYAKIMPYPVEKPTIAVAPPSTKTKKITPVATTVTPAKKKNTHMSKTYAPIKKRNTRTARTYAPIKKKSAVAPQRKQPKKQQLATYKRTHTYAPIKRKTEPRQNSPLFTHVPIKSKGKRTATNTPLRTTKTAKNSKNNPHPQKLSGGQKIVRPYVPEKDEMQTLKAPALEDDSSLSDYTGIALARKRDKSTKVKAIVGDMSTDFLEPSTIAPKVAEESSQKMMPYLGLGFTF